MKDSELQIDRSCHVLYSKPCKKEILAKITLHYPEVEHTNAWTIPGTEDLKPYITAKDKRKKWLFGTVGMAVIAMVLAAMMTIFTH